MVNQTIEQRRSTDKGSELIARLSNHMHVPSPLREAQILAAEHATKYFKGDVDVMIDRYKHDELFQAIVTEYGRKQLGI